MTILDSVRDYVLTNLPHERADPKVVSALAAKSPAELLVIFLNWRNRFVSPTSRKVLRSPAFDANPIVVERSAAVATLVNNIMEGRDLTKYLSRHVAVGFSVAHNANKKHLNRRRDLDLLLNDWGIHHLHISTAIESDGFVARDGPLIFAVFKPLVAYLIEVMNHGVSLE
jgi:hypothetical protein